MALQTDEQTIGDLGIFSKQDGRGIYDIYNHTHTRGGESLLEEIFRRPLSDKTQINRRSSIIESFARLQITFPYPSSLFDMVEKYLHAESVLNEKEVQNGVNGVIDLIRATKEFISRSNISEVTAYSMEYADLKRFLEDPAFEPVLRVQKKEKPSYAAITAYDTLFRSNEKHKIKQLLQTIYFLDVCISVAQTAVEKKFIFPRALDKAPCRLRLDGVYYPGLKQPVGNNISIDPDSNVIFLTGANMAGKSTFLRAVSTALYVAHLGFPVAATAMDFSVLDGIYTTINLPDNLGIGASHFYAEVTRVKKTATALSSGKSFFILFDELFRGTNVKDAHEATVAVMDGFAGKRSSMFIVSSHIVEAGESLQHRDNISFLYMPTKMNGHTPTYTYKLERGITDDRHGMIIIRNEGILDILEKGAIHFKKH